MNTRSPAPKDLVEIQQLPYNWDDFPYIFYQVELSSGQTKTLAFRGDQTHKGIAHHYGRVEPSSAHTIARAIFSEAPKSVERPAIDRDQFQVGQYIELAKPSVKPMIQ